jgi:uncharacterized protein (TIGR03067 family)
MQKVSAIIVFLVIAAMIGVAAGGEKTAAKIEGTWIYTTWAGKKLTDEDSAKLSLVKVFKDGKYTVSVEGKTVESGTYTVDESKKPATIDLARGYGEERKTLVGIYKIEGDTLTMVRGVISSKDRPKSFDDEGKGLIDVFKRRK